MRFRLLSDAHWEARVDAATDALDDRGLVEHFERRDYGKGLQGLTVILMCQDPELSLKRRVRHSKKESKLYMDIMLDLPWMISAKPEERKKEIVTRLYDEVPEVLSRYQIPDFDKERFVRELRSWLDALGWR